MCVCVLANHSTSTSQHSRYIHIWCVIIVSRRNPAFNDTKLVLFTQIHFFYLYILCICFGIVEWPPQSIALAYRFICYLLSASERRLYSMRSRSLLIFAKEKRPNFSWRRSSLVFCYSIRLDDAVNICLLSVFKRIRMCRIRFFPWTCFENLNRAVDRFRWA